MDNIRMDLQEVGCGHVDWVGLAQDRDRWRTVVSAVMNLRVPLHAGNFLTSCKPVSCSGRTLHHAVSKRNVSTNCDNNPQHPPPPFTRKSVRWKAIRNGSGQPDRQTLRI